MKANHLPYHEHAIKHFGAIEGARTIAVAAPAETAMRVSAPLVDFVDPEVCTRVLIDYDPAFDYLLARAVDIVPPRENRVADTSHEYDAHVTEAVAHFGHIEGATIITAASPARKALAVVGLLRVSLEESARYILDYDPEYDYLLVRSVPVMSDD